MTLATNDIAFREREHRLLDDLSVSKGNFLEIINLLARYDDVLSDLLRRPKHSVKYLSPAVQNELIDIISSQVIDQIQEEIKQATFVSVIFWTQRKVLPKLIS